MNEELLTLTECTSKLLLLEKNFNSQRKKFIIILSIIAVVVLFILYCGSALAIIAGYTGYQIEKKDKNK